MTTRGIAQRRLVSQQLVGAKSKTPGGVVRRLAAVQAQDYAGAKWAVGQRMLDATDAVIERAFARGAILRTHVLRPTWHFVTPADIRWLLSLTAPRVHAANAYMHRRLSLDAATFRRSNDALAMTLQGGRHLTRDELRRALARAGVATDGDVRVSYLMMRAELDGVVCSGPRRAKQFTYALLEERVGPAKALERDEALAELARRFFASRGPATVHDFAKWSGLTMADARSGLGGVSRGLDHETLDGTTYWFSAAARPVRTRSATAHLLSIYDEYVSGYRDRSALVSPTITERLAAMGNASTSIVVVDGRIVGAWWRSLKARRVSVKVELLDRLTQAQRRAVETAVGRYGAFLASAVEKIVTTRPRRRA